MGAGFFTKLYSLRPYDLYLYTEDRVFPCFSFSILKELDVTRLHILFIVTLLSSILAPVSFAEFFDTVSDEEQEVERIILGSRGTLTFANKVQDVIEGVSCGIVYLARHGDSPRPILQIDGFVIDNVWYVDLTGDSLKEIAVSWKSTSQHDSYTFQVFQVTVSGVLEMLFPLQKENEYIARGTPLLRADGAEFTPEVAFALRQPLFQISKEQPFLMATTQYSFTGDRFQVFSVKTDEPETMGQRLNLAAHYYSMRNFDKGLSVARSALEGIRAFGPRELLGKAYSLVARGYDQCRKPELAALYHKRANLAAED